MKRLQWPWAFTIRLSIFMQSGLRLEQIVWAYKIKHGHGDEITDVSYTWAGNQRKLKLIRAGRIDAVGTELGPLRWRGFFA